MNPARKVTANTTRKTVLDNEFNASIDRVPPPLPFRANFSRVNYPGQGDYLTITSTYRNPGDDHIKSIKVIFREDPVDDTPQRSSTAQVFYNDTAEDPPSEYYSSTVDTDVLYDPDKRTISGVINAHVTDGLENPKQHGLQLEFNLVAEPSVRLTSVK
jgi:hypothetical protein